MSGNHDLSLDANYRLKYEAGWSVVPDDFEKCRNLIEDIPRVTYLQHRLLRSSYRMVALRSAYLDRLTHRSALTRTGRFSTHPKLPLTSGVLYLAIWTCSSRTRLLLDTAT